MAIRPVDLQLVYLSGPQNASQAANAQQAPQAAQAAAAAAFSAEIARREESVAEAAHVGGAKIRADDERRGSGGQTPQRRRRGRPEDEPAPSSDGETHFIDITV